MIKLLITLLVTTKLLPHTTTKSLGLDVLTLLTRNLRGIIADEQTRARIVAVASSFLIHICDRTALLR